MNQLNDLQRAALLLIGIVLLACLACLIAAQPGTVGMVRWAVFTLESGDPLNDWLTHSPRWFERLVHSL